MGTLENYLLAVRPWSFSASMMPVLLGSALAYSSLHTMSFLVLFLTCISALCVHAAANLFNTYVNKKLILQFRKTNLCFVFVKLL